VSNYRADVRDMTNTKEKKVLIVEDEKPIAKALQLKLQKSGFITEVANNGKEGLDVYKTMKPDLILLDLIMPVLDGFGFLSEIRKTDKKTKVIVLTNLGQAEDLAKTLKLGASQYFIKSETPLSKVVEIINQLIDT
jgi:DNA-binding response OmpR family regulator